MRRSLYRPQNASILACGHNLCEDINRTLRRSGSRSGQFEGFCGPNSAYLYIPGTCSMCSATVASLGEIMYKRGVSEWDWQLYDHGVQLRFTVSNASWWLGIIILTVLAYSLYYRVDVH